MEFKCLGNKIPEYKKDMECILQTYNKISGIIKINSGEQMSVQTKLIHRITVKITRVWK
jgi:hypothetical protein